MSCNKRVVSFSNSIEFFRNIYKIERDNNWITISSYEKNMN